MNRFWNESHLNIKEKVETNLFLSTKISFVYFVLIPKLIVSTQRLSVSEECCLLGLVRTDVRRICSYKTHTEPHHYTY
jgi:hypothetical protein